MRALPAALPTLPAEEISGLSCPECFGVLNVGVEGLHHRLHFRCRIGHSYSADTVLIGKERVIEENLWGAVTALAELSTFLRELVETGRAGEHADVFTDRAARADEEGRRLRQIIEAHDPVGVQSGQTADQGVK
jgi:two-component system chemotaxis response regulator CheB